MLLPILVYPSLLHVSYPPFAFVDQVFAVFYPSECPWRHRISASRCQREALIRWRHGKIGAVTRSFHFRVFSSSNELLTSFLTIDCCWTSVASDIRTHRVWPQVCIHVYWHELALFLCILKIRLCADHRVRKRPISRLLELTNYPIGRQAPAEARLIENVPRRSSSMW